LSIITKSEWLDWKSNPVTRAFYAACKERVEDSKDILATSAGMDSDNDNFMRGFISAYNEMNEFRIEDLSDED